LRDRVLVGEAEVDPGAHSGRRQRIEPRPRAAGEDERRTPGGQVDDPEVAPEHAAAEPCPERLGARLLGGEALGVSGGAVGAPLGLRALLGGEDAREEALAEPRQRLLDAPDVDEIAADADDHALLAAPARASSMRARMRRIAPSSPMKIASPTRKWPMLSSTIV